MPEMSGKEVTDALKALNPNVKIIISSGYSQQDIKNKIDISEVSGFIPKPYSLQSLLILVQSVI
jgi:CheY-like chemotaxis protein